MTTKNYEKIKSVGIDIGTSTTQFVISQLTVKNVAPGTIVPRMQITDKLVEYKSQIYFTPFLNDLLIDTEKIVELIKTEYDNAGVKPEDIQTGAVIITGETAKKENARKISEQIAGLAGDFVVATAGGKLEAIIAGKGSGASDYSRKNYCVVANIDIGGGTSNVGVFKNGKSIDSCCINIGGRLLKLDRNDGEIVYITEPMKSIFTECLLDLRVGEKITTQDIEKVCSKMSQVVLECITKGKISRLSETLLMTPRLRLDYKIDVVMISGGVADFVYENNTIDNIKDTVIFGDIGPMLGKEIKICFGGQEFQLVKPTETIRATVIGAGSQTVDVSGSTIVVNNQILPLKNVPVIKPFMGKVPLDEFEIGDFIKRSIENLYQEDSIENIAIAIEDNGYWSFADTCVIAKGILKGLNKIIQNDMPVIIVLEQDCAKVLGQTLKAINPNCNVICIDQVQINEGDYIDIGKLIAGDCVVPVVIKTLVFETSQVS
ncbi:ethanolamine ammonia-lyase reactivating factor EutA [Clostridium sp.]